VSCPPDFENELALELKSFWFEMIDLDGLPTRTAFPEPEVIRGGLQFDIPEHLGYQINFFSKIASRVLLRIAKFDARYFDQFEKGFAKVEFEKYFEAGAVQLKAESHKSRINNDKNIIEAATSVLKKKKFTVTDESPSLIYIRIDKDRVTVSLDTSGGHLHRRGYATFRGEAPLRETLAALLIRRLQKFVAVDSQLTLIDPFAGSGTILFEAASFKIPNLQRPYSWLGFKNSPKLFKSDSWKKNYRWVQKEGQPHLVAAEILESAVQNIENNRREFEKIFEVTPDLQVITGDSAHLKLNPGDLRRNVWMVTNPPYGIRMQDENAREILESFDGKVDGLIVIHPVAWKFRFSKMKQTLIEDFSNQGLNLKLSVFQNLPAK
jgi:putative N6-adenine-specific DNA methylase